jgi:hypothetical protein
LKKLAGFLEVEPEELRSWLLVNKQRSRQTRWTENGLLDGEVVNANDLDYAMQGVRIFACSFVESSANHCRRISFTSQRPRLGGNW